MLRVHTKATGFPGGDVTYFHYFAGPGTPTLAEATEGVGRVRAFWLQAAARCANTMIWQPLSTVDVIDPVSGDITSQFAVTPVVSVGGSLAGDRMPGQTCAVAQYLTGVFLNGRQVRGRTFVGTVVEANSDSNGRPDTTVVANTISAGQKLALTILTPLAHVVYHRTNTHGSGSAVSVAGYNCNSEWGMVRHRMTKGF